MSDDIDSLYRGTIDRLVLACQQGQGQIASRRVRSGKWNAHATSADQQRIDALLARLPTEDRGLLARMLEDEFVGGVHEALVVLHEEAIVPFDKAYEGSPFHDFVGRLNGWEWPDSAARI